MIYGTSYLTACGRLIVNIGPTNLPDLIQSACSRECFAQDDIKTQSRSWQGMRTIHFLHFFGVIFGAIHP
jgi:hypothetical protein